MAKAKVRSPAMQAMHEAVHGVKWDARVQTPDEARRMRAYVRFAEMNNGGPLTGLCKTCAFRPGTEAYQSATVLELIEQAALGVHRFMCHSGATINPANGCIIDGTEPDVPCKGFDAFAANNRAARRSVPTLSDLPVRSERSPIEGQT